VSATELSAVELRGAAVVWQQVLPRGDGPVGAQFGELLGPRLASVRDLRMVVAVGPHGSQLRQLHGMPAVSAEVTGGVLRENQGRFFLMGKELALTETDRRRDGSCWGGVLDAQIASGIVEAATELRLEIVAIVPAVVILPLVVDESPIRWRDGEVLAACDYVDRELVAFSRRRAAPVHELADRASGARSDGGPAPAIVALAAARAAASTRTPACSLHPSSQRGAAKSIRQLAFACAALVLSGGLALSAPGIAAVRHEREAVRQTRMLGASVDEAAAVRREQRRVARELQEVTPDGAATRSATLLLAELTQAIEPPAVVTMLRFDPTGGSLTAVVPRASLLLQQLAEVRSVTGLAIQGAVTPVSIVAAPGMSPAIENAAGARMERLTVRFAWSNGVRGDR
jgi:hypothetical protein